MAKTQNSIASLLEQFARMQNNALDVLSKLSEITTTAASTVTFTQVMEDGTVETYTVPSVGSIWSNMNRIDENVRQLSGLGDASALVRMPDGTVRRVFASSVLKDPAPIAAMQVPSEFSIKSNWFFEDFLNPLMSVQFDVSGQVPDDMERAAVKRVILNADTDEKRQYFDDTYKSRGNIQHDQFILDLDARGIDFFVDESVVDLPVSIVRFTGTFDVLRFADETVTVNTSVGTGTVRETRRKYILDKFTYTDVVSGLADTRIIKNGDRLLTSDGSKYLVESANASENSVILRLESGSQPVSIGAGVLSIYSETFRNKTIQVGVGHNERQVIFIKPIVPRFNVAASTWSPGSGFYTNDLTINTTEGLKTLNDFYKEQVVDFGKILVQSAMEKSVPSALGEKPNAPQLTPDNFRVVVVNQHKTSDKQREDVNRKLESKVKLENEIAQVNKAIDKKKNDLNTSGTRSEAERRQMRNDLDALVKRKSSQVTLYNSVVKELATKAVSDSTVREPLKFRVRGFFPIPDPRPSEATGPQSVVQFKIEYRYMSKDGSSPQSTEIQFTDTDGKIKSGSFTNWNQMMSGVRSKVYNETTGFYEWDGEDVQDSDAVNINQIDIPISKGEKVQFRVKSLSEAGWPVNPVESDWSEIVTVDFPEDLALVDSTSDALNQALQEETRVKFQEELDARSLDLHLLTSFTNGDSYYAHGTSDIASGFFDDSGKVISLYQYLLNVTRELVAIRELIQKAKGTLAVYLIDASGNVTRVTNNSTVSLFAGYYKDLVKSGSGLSVRYDWGKVITNTYTLRIENSAATALELASYLPGGAGVAVPDSETSEVNDYKNNRKYDLVPITLTGITAPAINSIVNQSPFQSSQVQGQWLYSRYKSVALDQSLYGYALSDQPNNTVDQGVTTDAPGASPVNGCYTFPTDPTLTSGTQDVNVWNGMANFAGNGYLSEFCVHKDHPIAQSAYSAATFVPQIASGETMKYPPVANTVFSHLDITQADAQRQLGYVRIAPWTSGATTAQNMPAKTGFTRNDEFTIGRFSCGSYLFLAPTDHEQIRVEGTTELAKRLLEFGEDKGINIPVVFQFRCADKLGFVGGYRTDGTVTNITYSKKIGIDLQVRGEAPFGFDIEVSAKFEQDNLIQPTYIPNNSLESLRAIR